MDILLTLGSGVAVNYISSEFIKNLSKMQNKRGIQLFERFLEKWSLDFEKTHDGTIATSSEFIGYVKNYRVIENVISYILLPEANGVDEQSFLMQMQYDMCQKIEEKVSHKLLPEDIEVICIFLENLLAQTKMFMVSELPDQEKILLYGLCQIQAWDSKIEKSIVRHFGVTEENLRELYDELKTVREQLSALGTSLFSQKDKTIIPPEFDSLILKYNNILKKSQQRVKVYSWNDLDFDAVYVPPQLEANIKLKKQSSRVERQIGPLGNTPIIEANGIYTGNLNGSYSQKTLALKQQIDAMSERRKQINLIFNFSNIIYVVGGPGYGKSLFLKNLCVCPDGLVGYREKPLLIIRGDLKRMIQSDGMFKPMYQYLEECFVHACLQKPDEFYPRFLEYCLKAGRCLVLLDALDEVGNDQRNELHQRVISYFQEVAPGNKVCITSRDRGFIPAEHITYFNICAIKTQDVAEYVDRFIRLEIFPQEEKERFIAQAEKLVKKGFITGFLTLSLLLAIYKNEQELPANKISLYEKCFEYIANQRERNKKLLWNSSTGEEYDWVALNKLMGEATFMHLSCLGTPNNHDIHKEQIEKLMDNLYGTRFQSQTECREATTKFLQFCADRTEVFVPSISSNLEYCFFHRSFYEFFYANYLVLYSTEVKDTYEKLYDFEIDSEIFELLVELYYQKNPTQLRKLIQYAFEQAKEQLQVPSSKSGKIFDILIMLMQMSDEIDITEHFIELFLKYGGRISNFKLKCTFDLLQNIFIKKPGYLEILYYKNYKFYEEELARCIAIVLLRDRKHVSQLLQGEYSYGLLSQRPKGYRYGRLVDILPNQLELLKLILTKMKSPQYLYHVLKIQEKDGNVLLSFSNKVCNYSKQRQEKICSLLLSLI